MTIRANRPSGDLGEGREMTRACQHAILCLCLVGVLDAAGADEASRSDPTPASGVAEGAGKSIRDGAPEGDTITMTSGKVLMGFQVLRETVSHYVVEIIPSAQTLRLPKSLVESVVYDDVDPRMEPRGDDDGSSPEEPVLLPGQQMQVRLIDALSQDISQPEFPIDDMDCLQTLNEISERTGVRIRVDVTVTGIPPEQRRWSSEVPRGANGMTLIDALVRAFPDLRAVYQQDDVLITTRTDRPSEGTASRDGTPTPPSPE